ncbi:hypothetical protein Gpo141_00005007 [Globisporangium polare]
MQSPTSTSSTTAPSTPRANSSGTEEHSAAGDANQWTMKSNGRSSNGNENGAEPSSHHRRSPAVFKPKAPTTGGHGVDNNGGQQETGELFSEDDELLRPHHSPKKHQQSHKHKHKHQRQLTLAMSTSKSGAKHQRTPDSTMGSLDSLSLSSVTNASGSGASAAPLRHSRANVSSTREKLSILAVVVHLCKGNIGPGAMSLPNGFSQTGIYAAPVMFVIVALVSVYNMDLLLYCKRAVAPTTRMSFGDVGREILGPKGKLLIDVFLVGTQLGICCVYFTFVATNIHVVLPEKLQSVIHERQLILAIFPILLLLSWVRTLKRITPFSSLANVAVVSGIAIVFYYSLDYYANPTKPRIEPIHVDWTAFPEFYGTAVYSFEGIGLILPIQNEMSSPHLFPRVLALCMLLILVLFLVIGEVPTIAFGRITNGSMTAVLHDYCEGWGVTAANALLAFACLLSFPIQFYPAIEVLEKSLSRPGSLMRPAALPHTALNHRRRYSQQESGDDPDLAQPVNGSSARGNPSSDDENGHSKLPNASTSGRRHEGIMRPSQRSRLPRFLERMFNLSQYECNRTIFRSMICTSLMIVAICIPDVGLLISLFGAVGSSMLAIIIPPMLYIKLHKHSLSLGSRVFHYGIIVFGVVGMVAGTLQALAHVAESLF